MTLSWYQVSKILSEAGGEYVVAKSLSGRGDGAGIVNYDGVR